MGSQRLGEISASALRTGDVRRRSATLWSWRLVVAAKTAATTRARAQSGRRRTRSRRCRHLTSTYPKEEIMQMTRNSLDTNAGPSDWFTGTVYIDTIAAPSTPSRVAAALVHFTPGARTAWHT